MRLKKSVIMWKYPKNNLIIMFKLRDMKVGATQNPGLSIYLMYLHSDLEQWKSGEFPGWQKMCEIQVENIFSNFKVHWKILVCHLTKIFALWPGKGKKFWISRLNIWLMTKDKKRQNWKNFHFWLKNEIWKVTWDTIFWIDFPHNSEVNFPLNCK